MKFVRRSMSSYISSYIDQCACAMVQSNTFYNTDGWFLFPRPLHCHALSHNDKVHKWSAGGKESGDLVLTVTLEQVPYHSFRHRRQRGLPSRILTTTSLSLANVQIVVKYWDTLGKVNRLRQRMKNKINRILFLSSFILCYHIIFHSESVIP